MKPKIYIASPYTKGDVAVNVKRQLDMADQLMTLGYAPFAPLYSHFQHMAHPRPYTDWIAIDLEWVPACDAVLRLDGESSGADGEVAFARERGVPVVFSLDELRALLPAEPMNGADNGSPWSDEKNSDLAAPAVLPLLPEDREARMLTIEEVEDVDCFRLEDTVLEAIVKFCEVNGIRLSNQPPKD